ncbi:ubiquitin-specific protease ubp15 [Coemansia sp. RSA 1365]|nr:ubiquitin-specific protease ubp15 [Coemansia sp. RSA 1365]
MEIKREGENDSMNPLQEDVELHSDSETPSSLKAVKAEEGSPADGVEPKQYKGLSVLEEEDFINTNLPLPAKLEEEGHGVFHWEVDNWTQLPDRAVSKTFTVAGHDWDILLFPRGNQASEIVSLYIEHKPNTRKETTADWHVCAMFCLTMSNIDDPELFRHSHTHHRYVPEESDWGFTKFTELRHIMTPADAETPPLLDGGRVRISAFVRVMKDPLGVLWHNFHNYSSRKQTGYVGMRNQGATCYMNSLLQSLYFTNEFRNAVYQIPTENDDPKKSVALALQRVFYNLQVSEETVDTTELTKSFGWDTVESFMQHDVQEFNRVLQDNLETKMKGTEADGAVARLFEGKMKSYIRCVNVDYESSRVENYYDISLNVKGCATLRDSFANYCEVETLEGENKYQAEGYGLQDARKGVIFESFPPVLQLQLKRFEYDFMRDAMVKINDRHEFPPTIDLQEFLSDDADRSMSWKYVLHGVLVHSGDLHSGHYFGLLRPTTEDKWFRFDDDRVVPVTRDEVFEEYYGGEFPQPPGQPGMRARPSSKRYTNAYMLVYIREALRDRVLNAGDAPIPEHLLKRIQEERDEDARRQLEKEALASSLMVQVAGGAQFSRHRGFDLSYFDQRQAADNALFAERLPRTMTLREFSALYAERTGQDPGFFRLWSMVGRVNKTVRCEQPLAADDLTLAQVLEARSSRWSELRLFCETYSDNAPDPEGLASRPLTEVSLVHIKFYDPSRTLMGGVGNIYIQGEERIADIVPTIRTMIGVPADTPLMLFEEVKPTLIEELDPTVTFQKAEIQCGDIICVQRAIGPEESYPLPLVPDYFDDVQNRVSVRFIRRPSRADEDYTPDSTTDRVLVLAASTKTPYDRIAQWVADQVGMRDPLKLRFYTVSPTGQPRQPVRRMASTTLADMLPSAMFVHLTLNAEGLLEYTVMYEPLEVNIVQIESMRNLRVTYVGKTIRDEHQVEVLVPKVGTAQQLMEATYGKVEQLLRTLVQRSTSTDGQQQSPLPPPKPFSLQFYVVGYHRITHILTGEERLADLGSPGVSDIVAEHQSEDAEVSQMDEDADAADSKQLEVFHFYRDLPQTHSIPFLFTIRRNEPWSETWQRLQRRLGMGEKELKNLGVVCGPKGVNELKRCRIIQGVVSKDVGGTASGSPQPMEQTTPPPTSAESEGVEVTGSRSESVEGSDTGSNTLQPIEINDSMCLWDILQQMVESNTDNKDDNSGIVGFIGLNHVDRISRHRNLQHERAIRILN